ncbi:extracelullar DNA degradation protein, EddB [Salinisphaera orenii MK-B5]|uniref:Extracelullar DNA degradation protein, EddB n=1 Tax=Salinisphaera orenii MK-B5 TaxID=856730 RepID=A0A423PGF1_9GAMM|nr:ExeM/NucH family extracellular endonuclease [Salinisphaera orenii]ROO24670.1 extracelullar DNA degradation protein, EddB [Salinisphaera orenii MK-B5]
MTSFGRAGLAALTLGAFAPVVHAAPGLFFSEYVEGSSYNKSLEIYNPTDAAVDLDDYAIAVYFNGSADAGATIALEGTIEAGETFVFADQRADAVVLAAADQTYGGSLYNGDDTIALLDDGAPVDVIGRIGVDPGSAWGSGSVSTRDHTLRRDTSVTNGRADGDTPFDPANEWSGYPADTFADLGTFGESQPPSTVAFGSCGDDATAIHAIQGPGADSPLVNEMHVVEAIVTAVYGGSNGLEGFFVQAADGAHDSDPRTSEGLFVYTGDTDDIAAADFATGQRVRLRGEVTEFNGLTELRRTDRAAVCGSGYAVSPSLLALPFASPDAPEALEGMRVTLRQRLTVSGNYTLGRFGEVVLSAGGRLQTPTNVVPPGEPARALAELNARNRLVLDDGLSTENPDPVIYPAPALSAFNTLRLGDAVTGIEGVLSYGFGDWRVQPTATPVFDPVNPRPTPAVLPQGGNLRVASANVLNFFNGNGQGGGFPTARGADSPEELARQRAKLVAAITALDADIVGLMEIENDGYGPDSAIQELVDSLNAAGDSDASYAVVDPGSPRLGADAIAVGLIYDSQRVRPVGEPATLTTTPYVTGNRQPIAQTFAAPNGGRVTVAVNHFKSKGSCPGGDDPNADQGDGQSCWNVLRTQAAEDQIDWLADDPTDGDTDQVLVIGDLNAYAQEDPITAFERAGYRTLLERSDDTPATTYVFDAQSGALDHALANGALQDRVLAAVPFHINADEPPALDYNIEYKSPAQIGSFYNPGPYRASDHDPVVIQLDLAAPQ